MINTMLLKFLDNLEGETIKKAMLACGDFETQLELFERRGALKKTKREVVRLQFDSNNGDYARMIERLRARYGDMPDSELLKAAVKEAFTLLPIKSVEVDLLQATIEGDKE